MYYGAHKAMMEIWLATLVRRGELAALSVRLPGIVARPAGSESMKSGFMSDVFHALAAGHKYVMPVLPSATLWLMSLDRICANLAHALDVATGEDVPASRAVQLPALRLRAEDLVLEIARQTGSDPALVTYEVDDALQEGFGQQPPLDTSNAERLGFRHDSDIEGLVRAALNAVRGR
jgi:nucleoside-diphosphate-sugar epimerase